MNEAELLDYQISDMLDAFLIMLARDMTKGSRMDELNAVLETCLAFCAATADKRGLVLSKEVRACCETVRLMFPE